MKSPKRIVLEDVARKIQSRIGGKFVSYERIPTDKYGDILDDFEISFNLGGKYVETSTITLNKHGVITVRKSNAAYGISPKITIELANPNFDNLLNDAINDVIDNMISFANNRLKNLIQTKREICQEIPVLQNLVKRFK